MSGDELWCALTAVLVTLGEQREFNTVTEEKRNALQQAEALQKEMKCVHVCMSASVCVCMRMHVVCVPAGKGCLHAVL